MNSRRAFITGVGILTSVGSGCSKTLEALRRNIPGIRPLTLFPASSKGPLPVGEIQQALPSGRFPRAHQLALEAAHQALQEDPGTVEAIVLGVTTGGISRTEELLLANDTDPQHYRFHGLGTVAEVVADEVQCTGPVITVSTACSSGAMALKIGLELIRSGQASRVLCGGVDALSRMTYFGFGMLKLVDPHGARPLDRSRAGMSVGEAAAMLLLVGSDVPPPRARAELLGGGLSCDAHHINAPHPEGEGALAAMVAALRDAQLTTQDVNYVNLHGTGTRDNDAAEAVALRRLFADDLPPLSSTKGLFAHSLAASGAVEAVVCSLGLQAGLLPANTGCREPDPDLGLSPLMVPTSASLEIVLSNSFGFGGNNVALVLGKPRRQAIAPSPKIRKRLLVLGQSCITGKGFLTESIKNFHEGASLAGVFPTEELIRNHPTRSSRRLKRLSKMTLALASQAVEQTGNLKINQVFFGTGFGALTETYDFLKELFVQNLEFSSPTDFSSSVHNAAPGQVAIWFHATGANITATGGETSFEQAMYLASLLRTEPDAFGLLIGVDEAHPGLTPLLDPNIQGLKFLSDGGGAVVFKATDNASEITLYPAFLADSRGNPRALEAMVEALGGASDIQKRFGAIFAGMPAGNLPLAQTQLERFVSLTAFSGSVIDYRKFTGEFASSSAVASILALDCVRSGQMGSDSLDGKGILVLGFGNQLSAVEVGR